MVQYIQSFIYGQFYKCTKFYSDYYWVGNVTNLVAENSDNNELQTTTKGVADYAEPKSLIYETELTAQSSSVNLTYDFDDNYNYEIEIIGTCTLTPELRLQINSKTDKLYTSMIFQCDGTLTENGTLTPGGYYYKTNTFINLGYPSSDAFKCNINIYDYNSYYNVTSTLFANQIGKQNLSIVKGNYTITQTSLTTVNIYPSDGYFTSGTKFNIYRKEK